MGMISDEFEDMIGDEEYCASGSIYDWCLHNGERGQLIIDEWNDEKNKDEFGMNTNLKELMIEYYKKYWWTCKQCGREFQMTTYHRIVHGQGCRACGCIRGGIKIRENNLKKGESIYDWCLHNGERGKLLIDEWNDEKNKSDFGMNTVMQEIAFNSVIKYWWTCKECRCDFLMSPYQRTKMSQGCYTCRHIRGGVKNRLNAALEGKSFKDWCLENGEFGKLLMSEWDDENNEMSMDEISINSGLKVNFICSICGKPYTKRISRRIQHGTGCKECKSSGSSFPEKYIYMALKQIYPDIISRGKAFGKVEYDICIPSKRFCIEYSGGYWHDGREERDSMKRELCNEYGVKYLEIIEHGKGTLWNFSDDRIEFTRSDRIVDQLNLIIEYIVKMMGHTLNDIDLQKSIYDANRVVYLPVDNNITKTHPELLKEWLSEKNNGLTPDCFSADSRKIITFTCCNCGKDNDVSLHSRTRFRSACPYCGYSVFDREIHKMSIKHSETVDVMYPELLGEWLDELNEGHSLSEFTAGMRFDSTWKCIKCKNIWKRKMRERLYDKTGCPHCGYNVFDKKIHKRAIKIKPKLDNRAFL